MERSPAKSGFGGSRSASEELGMSSSSPARRTKIKISGSTQTANQYSTGHSNKEYYSSQQRSAMAASGSPRHLSETTKERLMASQRRSPQMSTANNKSRIRRLSRERPALPQMRSLNSEYLSDSSDSMYGEAQKQTVPDQQPSEVWYHQQHNVAQNQEQHGKQGIYHISFMNVRSNNAHRKPYSFCKQSGLP
jgi:hypothetical protein